MFIGDENLRFTEEEALAIKDAERASSPSLTYAPDIRIPFPQQGRIPFNPHKGENFREMYQTFSERMSDIIQGQDNPIITALGVIIWLGVTGIFISLGLIWIAYKLLAFLISIVFNIMLFVMTSLFWLTRWLINLFLLVTGFFNSLFIHSYQSINISGIIQKVYLKLQYCRILTKPYYLILRDYVNIHRKDIGNVMLSSVIGAALGMGLFHLIHQPKDNINLVYEYKPNVQNSSPIIQSEIKAIKTILVAKAFRKTRLYELNNKPKEFLIENDKRNIIGHLNEYYIIELKSKEKRLIKMDDVELLNLPAYKPYQEKVLR